MVNIVRFIRSGIFVVALGFPLFIVLGQIFPAKTALGLINLQAGEKAYLVGAMYSEKTKGSSHIEKYESFEYFVTSNGFSENKLIKVEFYNDTPKLTLGNINNFWAMLMLWIACACYSFYSALVKLNSK